MLQIHFLGEGGVKRFSERKPSLRSSPLFSAGSRHLALTALMVPTPYPIFLSPSIIVSLSRGEDKQQQTVHCSTEVGSLRIEISLKMSCSKYLGRRIVASNIFSRRQSAIDVMDPLFGYCALLSNSAAIQKPIASQKQFMCRTYSIYTHGVGTLISSNTGEKQCIKLHKHKIIASPLQCINNKHGSSNQQTCSQLRSFQNVSQYHDVADDTLHAIQDAVEDLIEDNCDTEASDDEIPETNYSSGVLTLSFPPHGTWVINKQTPNQQLWWSSPLSGPRRYEYVEERERWVYTRVIEEGNDTKDSAPIIDNDEDTLENILKQELKELYGWNLDVDA